MRTNLREILRESIVVLVAFAAGCFLADNSSEIQKLRMELDRVKRPSSAADRHIRAEALRGRAFGKHFPQPFHAGTNDQPPATNGVLARARVTKEDIEQTISLQDRQAQGEFILQNERPVFRKLQEYHIERHISRTATNNAETYERVFGELGIKREIGEQLERHIERIHKASLEAEGAIRQILDARLQFDQRLRGLLSDESYSRYRQYEESKPARQELQNIQIFFRESKNAALNPQQEEALVRLIQQETATDDGWWHGPYAQLPDPKVGREEVAAWAEQQLQHAVESASKVMQRTAEVGLPDEFRNYLADYYANKVQQKQSMVDDASKPLPDANSVAKGLREKRSQH